MARKSKTDTRISAAYHAGCSGIEIPMMKLPQVYKVGEQAIAEGADDATLQAKMRAFVETIRCN